MQCLNGFMDGINWAAAIGSYVYILELFDSVPLIGSLLITQQMKY